MSLFRNEDVYVRKVTFADGSSQTTANGGSSSGNNLTTSGSNAPSPLYSPSETPTGVNPAMYVQDANGAWHSQAGIDTATVSVAGTGPQGPKGILTWLRRMFFRDTLAQTQSGKNAFISVNHAAGVGAASTNQDRAIWVSMGNVTGSITSFSITSNIVTLGIGSLSGGSFLPGQSVVPAGLSTGTYLNGVEFQIQTVTGIGTGSNTVVMSAAGFTHANVNTTSDSGKLDQILYAMECQQMELDIVGSPTMRAAVDGELQVLSLQCSDAHIGAVPAPNDGVGCIRAQYYRQVGTGNWGSLHPTGALILMSNKSTVDGSGEPLTGIMIKHDTTVTPTNIGAVGVQIVPSASRFPYNKGILIGDFGTNSADYAIDSQGGKAHFAGPVDAGSYRLGTAGPTWTSGTGSPEGVAIASIGSLYSRTDGGAGTTLYVKESGAGNTGWIAK